MLKIKKLKVNYTVDGKEIVAVDDVSLHLKKGEVLGIVGESGSGKSTVALSIMRLISQPGKIVAGEIIYQGQDLLKIKEEELIKIRGDKISIVFQDPFTSLNPVFSVGEQIAEVIRLHQGLSYREAWEMAIEMLDIVNISNPAARAKEYPHQFSGGMRQRVMIGMALACKPEVLIADEPTTALDVTIQAEILKLLEQVRDEFKLSIIYITHNFGIVKRICDRLAVMCQGKIVEEGETGHVLKHPREVYTRKLIECVRKINAD